MFKDNFMGVGNVLLFIPFGFGILVLVATSLSFSMMYSSTISGSIPNEELASQVFNYKYLKVKLIELTFFNRTIWCNFYIIINKLKYRGN